MSSVEIRVTWKEVPEINRNGEITVYEVKYEPLMTFDGMRMTEYVNTTNLTAILTNLEEFVEYNISVRAYTSEGPGPFSPPETTRTDEAGKQ